MTIADLTCADLTALYQRGALSPVEAARDVLTRIESHSRFNAFMPIQPEPVFEAAAESEARWRKGRPLGPLDGIPATVKDNIWLKGYPTRRGSKTTDETPATVDSPAPMRLREQGVVFIGKTCLSGARLDRGLPFAAHGHYAQSVESEPYARRFDGRRRSSRAARLGRAPSRYRWRWIIAHSGGLYRRFRYEAKLRSGTHLSAVCIECTGAPRTHDAPRC